MDTYSGSCPNSKTIKFYEQNLFSDWPEFSQSKILEVFNNSKNSTESGIFLYGSIIKIDKTNLIAGYIFAYSKLFNSSSDSILKASQRGCSPSLLTSNIQKSKYYKMCRVNGGSGLGRGSLGVKVNYGLCRFFLPKQQSQNMFNLATAGKGGEISHFVPYKNDNGFAGGVVFLVGNLMKLSAPIKADGGDSFNQGYINCGGGGGGSIKIMGSNITDIEEITANGGAAQELMGAGGGGKLIINATVSDFYENFRIEIPRKMEFNLGGTLLKPEGPQFYFTQYMLVVSRKGVFQGGIINTIPCLPGFYGSFCQECPKHTFKPNIGDEKCQNCPCTELLGENLNVGKKLPRNSVGSCKCANLYTRNYTLLNLGISAGVLMLLTGIFYLIMQKKSLEEIYMTNLRLEVKDIPFSCKIFQISGTNMPDDHWSLEEEPDPTHMRMAQYYIFRKEFLERSIWSKRLKIFLFIVYYISYSPLYLSLIRLYRMRVCNKLIKLIEAQGSYELFTKEKQILKWTTSSDYSSLFIELIDIGLSDSDSHRKGLNWDFKSTVRFPIIGSASYNKPLKLEIKDPHLVKMIDHLKSLVIEDEIYYDYFKIPVY